MRNDVGSSSGSHYGVGTVQQTGELGTDWKPEMFASCATKPLRRLIISSPPAPTLGSSGTTSYKLFIYSYLQELPLHSSGGGASALWQADSGARGLTLFLR